jgi:hypothetical protein
VMTGVPYIGVTRADGLYGLTCHHLSFQLRAPCVPLSLETRFGPYLLGFFAALGTPAGTIHTISAYPARTRPGRAATSMVCLVALALQHRFGNSVRAQSAGVCAFDLPAIMRWPGPKDPHPVAGTPRILRSPIYRGVPPVAKRKNRIWD